MLALRTLLGRCSTSVALASVLSLGAMGATGCTVNERTRVVEADEVESEQPPADQAENPPPPPSTDYTWANGHWEKHNHAWRWVAGHWQQNRSGYAWVDGHWDKRRGGWVWVKGRWNRV